MQIKDPLVYKMVETLAEHYRSNIANPYMRPALLQLPMDKIAWDSVEALTEKTDSLHYQGFDLEELYRQLVAAARFVSLARRDLLPTLRNRIQSAPSPGLDKVMRDMAISNFTSNLQVFADQIKELCTRLIDLDRAASSSRRPVYSYVPELEEVGPRLEGN
ncbi:MAG: hypothetical protein LBG76_10535 [Treponema sp.]|jgi:hypothetical protein|nr:hypothetical protein [Treponema sp.]